MPTEIQTRIEPKRGCGYRKAGGIYLVGPRLGAPCCKLPFPLTVCPTCGGGIHPARGWTWVDVGQLFGQEPCLRSNSARDPQNHMVDAVLYALNPPCPLEYPAKLGKAGLIWIGEQYYKTPEDFLAEASRMGISRRISAVPRGFVLGETWVLLAHRKGFSYEAPIEGGLFQETGIQLTETRWKPAIFSVFKPTAVEYVVKGDENEGEMEQIARRGLTPVRVINRVPFK